MLRPLLVEHAEEMAAVLADPLLHAFTGGSPLSAQALHSRYERLVAGSPEPAVTWLNWVVELRDEGCLVGTVQATVTAAAAGAEDGVAEIAWVTGSAWQRRGIAAEAAVGLVGWLVRQPVRTVIAHIHPDHRASEAVAAAAGLTVTDQQQDGETRWQRARGVVTSPRTEGDRSGSEKRNPPPPRSVGTGPHAA